MIDIIYLQKRLRSARTMAAMAADVPARMIHEDMARSYARRLAAMEALNGQCASQRATPFAPAVAPAIKAMARPARIAA
ncbi:hypothetical protein [Sphingobium aquiterrae]|uniref:hypothetical protein n=1 Tax=Sphingobium aquiterrae TaxID=2038656 RepID=UPI0030185877